MKVVYKITSPEYAFSHRLFGRALGEVTAPET